MCFFDGKVRDLGEVDSRLLADLKEQVALIDEAFWDEENSNKPNKFVKFDTTKHIVFQFPETTLSHRRSIFSSLWSDWERTIQPVIDQVTRPYQYKQGRTARIMLARLAAGGQIDLHVDRHPAADGPHKIHVPLQTHPKVEFWEEDASFYLAPGHAYEVNNKIMHGGANKSDEDRTHLIFDYYDAAA